MALPTGAGDKMLNICMNAKHHKSNPDPEDGLCEEVDPSGQDSELWVCHWVTRSVNSGGKTAIHPTLASLTGIKVGTGVRERNCCPTGAPCLPYPTTFPP